MSSLLDLNHDCIDHVIKWLKYGDPESMETMVALSQTCKTMQLMASRFLKHASYSCSISTYDEEKRAKGTISAMGTHLVALNVNIAEGYSTLKPNFFIHLPQKCPNLQKVEIVSNISPNTIFDGARMLENLEHLSIRCYEYAENVDGLSAMGLARESKALQSLKVINAEWDHRTVIEFIHAANNLDCFSFDIEYLAHQLHYEVANVFLEEFRAVIIEDPSELIYFLEFRDLLKTIFY